MVDFSILAKLAILLNYHNFILAELYNLNVPTNQELQFVQRKILAIWWLYLRRAPRLPVKYCFHYLSLSLVVVQGRHQRLSFVPSVILPCLSSRSL